MSAEKSAGKKRQQAGWWVLAFLLFILSLVGIRYISSQGWWENRFGSSRQTFQTINTGFSVQVPNQSDVLAPLNPSKPAPSPPTNKNPGGKGNDPGPRAWW